MPDYTKDEAARIRLMAAEADKTLKTLPISDLSDKPPEHVISALQALIQTLEQCIVIAYRHHHLGHSEPYPGACKQVMERSMQCVAVARASRILPEREL